MPQTPVELLFPLCSEAITRECEKFFYRYQRYDALFSMALFYSHEPLQQKTFEKSIRQSDRFLALQENLFCIMFDMTSGENGLKACENLLATYEAEHFQQNLYISYVCAEDYDSNTAMKSRLFSLLNYAIKEKLHNQITDNF